MLHSICVCCRWMMAIVRFTMISSLRTAVMHSKVLPHLYLMALLQEQGASQGSYLYSENTSSCQQHKCLSGSPYGSPAGGSRAGGSRAGVHSSREGLKPFVADASSALVSLDSLQGQKMVGSETDTGFVKKARDSRPNSMDPITVFQSSQPTRGVGYFFSFPAFS